MIVTDTGGLPELVNNPNYVVPPKNSKALANKTISCLQDPALLNRMSAEIEVVAETIAWPAVAKKTWSVYGKVLNLNNLPVEL